MRSKLIAPAVLAVALFIKPALANFYIKAELGSDAVNQTSTITINSPYSGFELEQFDSFAFKQALILGYDLSDFLPNVSLEADFTNYQAVTKSRNFKLTYKQKLALRNYRFDRNNTPVANPKDLDSDTNVSDKFRMYSFGLSAIYTFDTDTMIQPFLGLRIAYSKYNLENLIKENILNPQDIQQYSAITGGDASKGSGTATLQPKQTPKRNLSKLFDKTPVTFGVKTGLNFDFSANFSASVAYSYNKIDSKISTNGVSLGLAFHF